MPDINTKYNTTKSVSEKPLRPPRKKSVTIAIGDNSKKNKRERMLSNNLESFRAKLSIDGIPEVNANNSNIYGRSPSNFSSRYGSNKVKPKKMSERELKDMKSKSLKVNSIIVARIFKQIQIQKDRGEEINLVDIGIKETPYHKILLEEENN